MISGNRGGIRSGISFRKAFVVFIAIAVVLMASMICVHWGVFVCVFIQILVPVNIVKIILYQPLVVKVPFFSEMNNGTGRCLSRSLIP